MYIFQYLDHCNLFWGSWNQESHHDFISGTEPAPDWWGHQRLQLAPLSWRALTAYTGTSVWGRANVSQTHLVYPLDFSIHMNQMIHEPPMWSVRDWGQRIGSCSRIFIFTLSWPSGTWNPGMSTTFRLVTTRWSGMLKHPRCRGHTQACVPA